ncbi:MAG: His/Gly/Thr/Pro-type tRNA ligase C-terminal domain-containing protein, partial [Candidatus Aenigmatarchaeota archaeon]
LRRLRTFTMPDCHALCKDIEQAKEEILIRLDLSKEVLENCGLSIENDLEAAVRIVKDFYDNNKDFLKAFVKKIGKPVLLEMWSQQFFYFIFKYELNFVDALEKAAALSTDQIDVENAKRYGITYMDSDNTNKYPIILHLSPSGAIERVIYALLEKAHIQIEQKKNPILPLWLCPTQIRLIPVSDKFLKHTEKIAKDFEKENIRVDIDDRKETVQKKIRDAEVEWVPFSVVIGEKEVKSKKLAVRFRETGEVKKLSSKSLINLIKKQTENKPFKALSLPKLLSKRPTFIG